MAVSSESLMSPKRAYTFLIDSELADQLKVIKERDGISESEQIRRALKEWFAAKGLKGEATSRRVRARRKV
jgi:hypothetical protein